MGKSLSLQPKVEIHLKKSLHLKKKRTYNILFVVITDEKGLIAQKTRRKVCILKKKMYLCIRNKQGAIAQLVEQRTENPCVPGSIPGGTTLVTMEVP